MIVTTQTFLLSSIILGSLSAGILMIVYGKIKTDSVNLERLLEERTREIKKLQENQREVMLDISHNLQSPLAIIAGELELLTGVSAVKIQLIKKSIDRVSEFIKQLLHLARLDNSIYAINLSLVNLTILLQDQVEYFEVMAQENGVRVILSYQENIVILGHKHLLEELLTNLVSNAITYRDQQKKSIINISLSKRAADALLTIEDNGVGIAPQDLPLLFTRFYQGTNRSDIHTGTGLGLAICKKIVERHGGTITVESILGGKTIFNITIPLLFSDEIHLPKSFWHR